jgi:hypothetical protein
MELDGETMRAGGDRLTPAEFAARLRREPPDALELPDGVMLAGASLTAFLESAHYPFGQYRIGEERFFVTPSVQIDGAMLERRVQSPAGERIVGDELLVWRRVSFRVAAGTAAEERSARPFVGPTGARAYLWLGRPLPGGPLVLRDANNAEERVPIPEALVFAVEATTRPEAEPSAIGTGEAVGDRQAEARNGSVHPARPGQRAPRPPQPLRRPHPALLLAEQALRDGGSPAAAEAHLRAVMSDPAASGGSLARAGQLWQELGQPEIARAAYLAALERGCVEGALGLSLLAEATGEAIEAAAWPLDAAVARNLRSPALHARYAELLERLGQEAPAEWHRRRAEALERTEEAEWTAELAARPAGAALSQH